MSRKTQALYTAVFGKVQELAPEFSPTSAMADFEEASAAALQSVFGDVSVSGCWFHFAQAVMKRVNKIGLKDASINDDQVRSTVHCLVALPLLPPEAIPDAVLDIIQEMDPESDHISNLRKLIAYIQRQWINKRSVGPSRLSVRDNRSRTNNVLESYHATLRRRIKVSHPNLFAFLGHLQNTTTDNMNDVARVRNGLQIRRPKLKANLLNESRIKASLSRFDNGSYNRIQFLRAVSHAVGAHTQSLQPTADGDSSDDDDQDTLHTPTTSAPSTDVAAAAVAPSTDATEPQPRCCEVCLMAPIDGVALVPCGHVRFCGSCARTVTDMGGTCPMCRSVIHMVMRVFS